MAEGSRRAYDEVPLRLQDREIRQALWALERVDAEREPPPVRRRLACKLKTALGDPDA